MKTTPEKQPLGRNRDPRGQQESYRETETIHEKGKTMQRYVVMVRVLVSTDQRIPPQERMYTPPLSWTNVHSAFNRLTMAEVKRPAGIPKTILCHWIEPVEVNPNDPTIVKRILPPMAD